MTAPNDYAVLDATPTDLTDRLAESLRAVSERLIASRCYCDVTEPPCLSCRIRNARTVLAEYDARRAATRDHDDADREEAES